MKNSYSAALLFAASYVAASTATAADNHRLMGMIAEGRYPRSTINGAKMTGGATINSSGDRTVQSLVCKTVMTTDPPVANVVRYYNARLTPKAISDGQVDNAIADP